MSKTGIELIADERKRQVEVEGWTAEHDAGHETPCLAVAGACYALDIAGHHAGAHNSWQYQYIEAAGRLWPFDMEYFKPTAIDPIRQLVKAGALIAAEIDRIQNQGR